MGSFPILLSKIPSFSLTNIMLKDIHSNKHNLSVEVGISDWSLIPTNGSDEVRSVGKSCVVNRKV